MNFLPAKPQAEFGDTMIGFRPSRFAAAAIAIACLFCPPAPLQARTLLKNICRVKGQEENTLQGLGLVIGLKGTGDNANSLPTIRSLAQAIQLMGTPGSKRGQIDLKEDVKNVALVMVTATIPAAGARQATCSIARSARSAAPKASPAGNCSSRPCKARKSTANGSMPSPRARSIWTTRRSRPSARCFAAAGWKQIFSTRSSRMARSRWCSNKYHADFQVAQDVAELINSQLGFQTRSGELARAINQENIEVLIPPQYRDKPVSFVSQVLSLPMLEPQTEARVVINERAGSIVIGGDVEIGAVVITHKNMVIEDRRQPRRGAAVRSAQPLRAAGNLAPADAEAQGAGRNAQHAQGSDRRRDRNHQGPGTRRQTARTTDYRIDRFPLPRWERLG